MSKIRTTIYIREETWRKAMELAKRDGLKISNIVAELLEEWIRRKAPGNPQRPITAYVRGHRDHLTRIRKEALRRAEMSRRDTAYVKRMRLQRMVRMLRGTGSVNLEQFIAQVEYAIGLSPKTIRRYLRTLERAGFIRIEGDKIFEVKREEENGG